jgi:exonuclease VII small subunit
VSTELTENEITPIAPIELETQKETGESEMTDIMDKSLETIVNSLEHELTEMIDAYHEANTALKAVKDELEPTINAARARIEALMQQRMECTGERSYSANGVKVQYILPSTTVSYDSKGLDTMLDEHTWLKALRTERSRSGSVRITS